MHYRHHYHAGNFADVFKHLVLVAVLDALSRKDKPWCYLETHAGAGRYGLDGAAEQTGEWREGIARVLAASAPAPALGRYLEAVRACNGGEAGLRQYPGSPQVALHCARAGDRLVLCERVEAVYEELARVIGGDRRVQLHLRDGYELPSLLPPAEKRGLVMVDPPFERRDEFEAAAELVLDARRRFRAGVYAVWYPLKNRHEAQRFEQRLWRMVEEEVLVLRLHVGHAAEGRMRGCGMLIANAPYQLRQALEPALRQLVPLLAQGPGARYEIEDRAEKA